MVVLEKILGGRQPHKESYLDTRLELNSDLANRLGEGRLEWYLSSLSQELS